MRHCPSLLLAPSPPSGEKRRRLPSGSSLHSPRGGGNQAHCTAAEHVISSVDERRSASGKGRAVDVVRVAKERRECCVIIFVRESEPRQQARPHALALPPVSLALRMFARTTTLSKRACTKGR